MDEDSEMPDIKVPTSIQYGQIKPGNTAGMIEAGVAAGNISRPGDEEVMELPEASQAHRLEQQEKIQQLELQRTMKSLVVPVIDVEVRKMLRQMQEPITLFGEREMERRERLRKLLATMNDEQAEALAAAVETEEIEPLAHPPPKELFYTEGPPELKAARLEIAKFSLPRASARIAAQKEKQLQQQAAEDGMKIDEDELKTLEDQLRAMTNQSSEVGDERPVVTCSFSRDGAMLATGAWSGNVKVWNTETLSVTTTIKAHTDRITSVVWHPEASASSMDDSTLALASGAVDCTARLWTREGKLLRTLEGHTHRLGRIAFHPMGRHLATASFDQTWRLWDVETGHCLQEQEGHSRAVYAVAFQNDGALAVSGGLDAHGRVWDMRTGRSIMALQGHVKSVLAIDFSPNGYLVATGSEDNTALIFDLRKKGTLAVLPGHNSLIAQVRFEPEAGRYLLTSGYDNMSKLWCGKKFKLTKMLAGHEGKVMGSDICPTGNHLIATVGYDRTLKTWQPDVLLENNHAEM